MEKTFEQKLELLKAKEAMRKDMVVMRLAGATLQVIGDKHGYTRERVRQLLVGTKKKEKGNG